MSKTQPSKKPRLPSGSECPFLAGPLIKDSRYFVGRVELLRALRNLLKHPVPQSANIYGERRMGKSSLLYRFFQECAGQWPERPLVFVSLEDSECFTQASFFRHLAQTFLQSAGARGLSAATRAAWAVEEMDARLFSEALDAAMSEKVCVVFCLDEFEVITTRPAQFGVSFLTHLRGLTQRQVVMFVASSRDEIRHAAGSSKFMNDAQAVLVGAFSPEEAAAVAALPRSESFPHADSALDAEDRALVLKWGGRSPYPLQLAGRCIWNARRDGASLDQAHAEFARERDKNMPLSMKRILLACGGIYVLFALLAWAGVLAFVGKSAVAIGGGMDGLQNIVIGGIVVVLFILVVVGVVKKERVVLWFKQRGKL